MKFNNRNRTISPQARIGSNVRIGDNTVIYAGVEIADGSTICNDCIIGEPLAAYYHDESYRNPRTVIGGGALIRSHAILYAGCSFGEEFSTGHRVIVRENTSVGNHCSFGTFVDVQGDVCIGNYTRLHSNVHIAQGCTIDDFVFFYPFSVMTNDPWPPSNDLRGGHVRRYTQVGVHAVILPGVQVGENCLIGANALVTRNVPDYSIIAGEPARVLMDIRSFVALGKGKPYPWMYRFDRGMPWQGIGYEAWMNRERVAG